MHDVTVIAGDAELAAFAVADDVLLGQTVLLTEIDAQLDRFLIQSWTPTYSGTLVELVYPYEVQSDVAEAGPPEPNPTPSVEAEIADDVPKSEEKPHFEQNRQASQASKQVIMNNYGKGVQIEELNGALTININ